MDDEDLKILIENMEFVINETRSEVLRTLSIVQKKHAGLLSTIKDTKAKIAQLTPGTSEPSPSSSSAEDGGEGEGRPKKPEIVLFVEKTVASKKILFEDIRQSSWMALLLITSPSPLFQQDPPTLFTRYSTYQTFYRQMLLDFGAFQKALEEDCVVLFKESKVLSTKLFGLQKRVKLYCSMVRSGSQLPEVKEYLEQKSHSLPTELVIQATAPPSHFSSSSSSNGSSSSSSNGSSSSPSSSNGSSSSSSNGSSSSSSSPFDLVSVDPSTINFSVTSS